MIRKRTRETPEVRRAQIVDEAIRIVGQLGYYGFTVQALAERCGITNAGLLYYFGSKDKLLLALLDEIERREEEAIGPVVALIDDRNPLGLARTDAVAGLVRSMAERVTISREQGRFIAMLQAESMEASHPAHQWFAQRQEETIDLLVRLLRPLTDKPLPMARRLMVVLYGFIQQWLRSGQDFNLADECEDAAKSLLRGLAD